MLYSRRGVLIFETGHSMLVSTCVEIGSRGTGDVMLSIETTWTCSTNIEWSLDVRGSAGNTYTVSYNYLFGEDAQEQGTQYGYTCTCPAFTVGRNAHKMCKHIKAVKADHVRCGWNWELEPTAVCDHDAAGKPCCPDCGASVQAIPVAV
jgi:hypothetical protein